MLPRLRSLGNMLELPAHGLCCPIHPEELSNSRPLGGSGSTKLDVASLTLPSPVIQVSLFSEQGPVKSTLCGGRAGSRLEVLSLGSRDMCALGSLGVRRGLPPQGPACCGQVQGKGSKDLRQSLTHQVEKLGGEGGSGEQGTMPLSLVIPRLTFLESRGCRGRVACLHSAAHLRGRRAQQLSTRLHEKHRWCQQVQIN